jgi:hypothetical protein
MEEKIYTIEFTSYECNDLTMLLFEIAERYKDCSPEDSQKIYDLAQKIKTQFFEQGNL